MTAFAAAVALVGGVSVAALAVPSPALAADPVAPVALGVAASFGVLTRAAVGNTATGPGTVVRGDLGAGGGPTPISCWM